MKTRGAAATPTKAKAAAPAAQAPVAAAAAAEAELEPAEIPDEPHDEPEQYHEEPEALSSPIEAHEHDGSESTLIDEPQHASTGLTDDPGVHAAAEETAEAILASKEEELAEHGVPDTSAEEALEEVVPKPEGTIAHEEGVPELPAAAVEEEEHGEAPLAEDHAVTELERVESNTPEAHDTPAHVNGKATPTPGGGTDLEDIVNMLETKPRPMSIATIPDEFDIPDQE